MAEAKRAARTERRVNFETGRLAWHARCAVCQQELVEGLLQADHVLPVVPVERNYDERAYASEHIGELVERLLPPPEGYQMLCGTCHSEKTKQEQEKRLELRRAAKAKERS